MVFLPFVEMYLSLLMVSQTVGRDLSPLNVFLTEGGEVFVSLDDGVSYRWWRCACLP